MKLYLENLFEDEVLQIVTDKIEFGDKQVTLSLDFSSLPDYIVNAFSEKQDEGMEI